MTKLTLTALTLLALSLLGGCNAVPVCETPSAPEKAFFRIDERLDYFEAEHACADGGGVLARPVTREENLRVSELCYGADPDAQCWTAYATASVIVARYRSNDPEVALIFAVCETWGPARADL